MSTQSQELECKVCGHHWSPRGVEPPEVCPNCKSRFWAVGRQRRGQNSSRAQSTARTRPSNSRVVRAFVTTKPSVVLPVYGYIPAGPLTEISTAIETYIAVDPALLRAREGDFLLRADGDSMTNGSWKGGDIRDGDYVLIRPNTESFYGEVAAVRVLQNDVWKSTLKRLCYHPGEQEAVLVALNPDKDKYPDIHVPAETVEVIGVYRGLVRGDN